MQRENEEGEGEVAHCNYAEMKESAQLLGNYSSPGNKSHLQ